MAPITIRDENELPAPTDNDLSRKWAYIRSMCDPRVMIAIVTGVAYIREDGEAWERPGLWATLNYNGKTSREPGTALFDSQIVRGTRETIS